MEDDNTTNFETENSTTTEASSVDNDQTTTQEIDQEADNFEQDQEHQQTNDQDQSEAESEADSQTRGEKYSAKLKQEIAARQEEKRQLEAELRDFRTQIQQDVEAYSFLKTPGIRELANQIMEDNPDMSESEALQQAQVTREEMREEAMDIAKHITTIRTSMKEDELSLRREFNFLDENDKENYDPEFTNMAVEAYEQVAGIERDTDGNILNARIRMKPFFQAMIAVRNHGIELGRKQNRSTMRKQMANANTPSGGALGATTVAFEKMTRAQQEEYLRKNQGCDL